MTDAPSNTREPSAHEEYLRRNLLHASSLGAAGNAKAALARLSGQKRPPRWLIEALEGIVERADKLPPDLARWRNCAPDRPGYIQHDDAEAETAALKRWRQT